MRRRALLVGAGNIGAGYDWDRDDVWTYAKAFSRRSDLDFAVADADAARARRVGERYGVGWMVEPAFDGFDIVAIAVPTPLHFAMLAQAIAARVPLVFCEKPVVATLAEADAAKRLDTRGSQILVNYFRRFQPGYAGLREQLAGERLAGGRIRYDRGFLNNAGHGLDLIEYLFDLDLTMGDARIERVDRDAFPDDPTITGQFVSDGIAVALEGTTEPVFEVDLDLASGRHLEIRGAGDTVAEAGTMRQSGLISDYMANVIARGLRCFDSEPSDNFRQAVRLNREMLTFIRDLEAP